MQYIGIDYQRAITVACLREQAGEISRTRPIGDGYRRMIPNAVVGDESWGTRALDTGQDFLLCGESVEDGEPWLEEPGADLFWKHLYRRVYQYLGRIQPTYRNRYLVVAAVHAEDPARVSEALSRLATAAGFSEPMVISASDALLARWIVEGAARQPAAQTVAVVAVGDRVTQVGAYQARSEDGLSFQFIRSGPVVIPIGQEVWIDAAASELYSRFKETPEGPPQRISAGLRDAVLSFAARLARSGADEEVPWTGPFQDRLDSDLFMTRKGPRWGAEWPCLRMLRNTLPSAIDACVRGLGAKAAPELVILGGVGAVWPFALDAIAGAWPTWHSEDPQEDIACGATWWPDIGQGRIQADALQPGAGIGLPALEAGSGEYLLGSESAPVLADGVGSGDLISNSYSLQGQSMLTDADILSEHNEAAPSYLEDLDHLLVGTELDADLFGTAGESPEDEAEPEHLPPSFR